jgi:hypothetical protein
MNHDHHKPTRAELHQAAIDSLLTALREARETRARVVDLESERDAYKSMAAAALECLAGITARNKILADRIHQLNDHIRELFDMPCPHCRGEGRRVA